MAGRSLCSVWKRWRQQGIPKICFCIVISFTMAVFTEAFDCLCSGLFHSLKVDAVHAVVSSCCFIYNSTASVSASLCSDDDF